MELCNEGICRSSFDMHNVWCLHTSMHRCWSFAFLRTTEEAFPELQSLEQGVILSSKRKQETPCASQSLCTCCRFLLSSEVGSLSETNCHQTQVRFAIPLHFQMSKPFSKKIRRWITGHKSSSKIESVMQNWFQPDVKFQITTALNSTCHEHT
jgi:hypothetical protein